MRFKKTEQISSMGLIFLMILSMAVGFIQNAQAVSYNKELTPKVISSVSTSISPECNRSRIAYYQPYNKFGELLVNGTDGAVLNRMNYQNAPLAAPVTHQEASANPYSFGLPGLLSNVNTRVLNPWNINWLQVDPNGNIDGTENYTFYYNYYPLNPLQLNQEQLYEVSNAIGSKWYEVDLNIETTGMYILYYGPQGSITTFRLIDPDGYFTSTYSNNLPNANKNAYPGQAISSYMIFAASKTGIHRFYFLASNQYFTMKLQTLSTTKNIKSGDLVKYQDEPDGVSLNDYWKEDPLKLHVYEINLKQFQYLGYNYQTLWGNPNIRLFVPNNFGSYSVLTITSSVFDNIIVPTISGKGYIVIMQNAWDWCTTACSDPIRQLLSYQLSLNSIPVRNFVIGDNSDANSVVEVNMKPGVTILRMQVTQEKTFLLNGTPISGFPTFSLNSLTREDPDLGFVTVNSLDNKDSIFLYDLAPGNYLLFVFSSYSFSTPEKVRLETRVLQTQNLPFVRPTNLKPNVYDNMTTTVTHTYPFDTPNFGGSQQLNPVVFNTTYDDYVSYTLNISTSTALNSEFFNDEVIPNDEVQIWVWNQTSGNYEYRTNWATSFDLFDAASPTMPAYIGFPCIPEKLSFNLHNVSKWNSINWSYYESFGYQALDSAFNVFSGDWNDETFGAGTTLSKSGSIMVDSLDLNLDSTDKTQFPVWNINANKSLYWFRLDNTNGTLKTGDIPALSNGHAINVSKYHQMAATFDYRISVLSRFDDKTYLTTYGSVPSSGSLTLSINKFQTNVFSTSTPIDLLGKGKALVSIWPRSATFYNSCADQTVHLDTPMKVRVVSTDIRGTLKELTTVNASNWCSCYPVNYSSFNNYVVDETYNNTEYSGLFFKVRGSQMYDWYQFILNSNNTAPSSIFLFAGWDNDKQYWTQNAAPTGQNSQLTLMNGITNRSTAEMGSPLQDFYLVVMTSAQNASELVNLKLAICKSNVKLLQVTTLPVIYKKTLSPGEVAGISVGVTAGIIVIIVVVVFLKKKGVF